MPVITPNYTLLEYDNVTVSIPHDAIITHDDLNQVSIRVHSLYKSLRILVEKYKIFMGKITIAYGYLYLQDDSFDDMHKDALESELIKHFDKKLIYTATKKLHKVYNEFWKFLPQEVKDVSHFTIDNYFAFKDFYENCTTRNKAMIVSGSESYTDCRMYGYEFDCSLPKFN